MSSAHFSSKSANRRKRFAQWLLERASTARFLTELSEHLHHKNDQTKHSLHLQRLVTKTCKSQANALHTSACVLEWVREPKRLTLYRHVVPFRCLRIDENH